MLRCWEEDDSGLLRIVLASIVANRHDMMRLLFFQIMSCEASNLTRVNRIHCLRGLMMRFFVDSVVFTFTRSLMLS